MESPAFSGARQQDVAAVRRALDNVAPFGRSIKLPLMTAAELCALGALCHPVVDARTLSGGTRKPTARRWPSRPTDTSPSASCSTRKPAACPRRSA
jgi:hypothetical protein